MQAEFYISVNQPGFWIFRKKLFYPFYICNLNVAIWNI